MKRDDGGGYVAGFSSIAINVLLFVLKFWAGALSGSVAIMADAWHSLSDSLTSIAVIVGLKISSRPPDREHQYGHGRAELIASMIVGVVLLVVAFNFILEGAGRLLRYESATYGTIALVAIVVSVIVKEVQAQYCFRVGKRMNLESVTADAWHHRTDALSSVVVLVGIFVSGYFWWIDGVLAIVIALLIIYATYGIFRRSTSSLLGRRIDPGLKRRIMEVASGAYPKKLHAHHFHIHDYGRHRELSFHIRLPRDMELAECHRVANSIERRVKDRLGIDTTVRVDPGQRTSLRKRGSRNRKGAAGNDKSRG